MDACNVVRTSIVQLCGADHQGDAPTLDAWLANKTADNFNAWITSPRHVALVGERQGQLAGFALLNKVGTIALLYVAPEHRFSGVTDSLLRALEECASGLGILELRLHSTVAALGFYERRGYERDGEPAQGFGVTSAQPLRKRLSLTVRGL
jgi:GNAT superfamily N-acetyltransferase